MRNTTRESFQNGQQMLTKLLIPSFLTFELRSVIVYSEHVWWTIIIIWWTAPREYYLYNTLFFFFSFPLRHGGCVSNQTGFSKIKLEVQSEVTLQLSREALGLVCKRWMVSLTKQFLFFFLLSPTPPKCISTEFFKTQRRQAFTGRPGSKPQPFHHVALTWRDPDNCSARFPQHYAVGSPVSSYQGTAVHF